MSARGDATARAKASFLRACELDVAVRKPGNVSRASAGHRMQADMFIASAYAAAGPLFEPGASVGARIEAAVDATWAVARCNTNLGILLLCAPIALAVELRPDALAPFALRASIEPVLAGLDLSDAQAAFRGIARAHPGGLGTAPEQDVHEPPSVDLRTAMALAAPRDSIARQYRDGFADLFDLDLSFDLAALGSGFAPGREGAVSAAVTEVVSAALTTAVQRLYLTLLSGTPDSHIVRKHGDGVAQIVMTAAQAWAVRARSAVPLDNDPAFAVWDESLKADCINPGTTADLTVAALVIAGLTGPA